MGRRHGLRKLVNDRLARTNHCVCTGFVAIFGVAALGLTPSSAQTTHTVELVGVQFVPANLTIQLGDTVHWVWVSGLHNVESGVVENFTGTHDGNFRSG